MLFREWADLPALCRRFFDGFSYFTADLVMDGGGGIGTVHTIFPQLFFGLRNAEQVCDQLCTAHVVENLLTDFQVLLAVNVIHGHAAVQSHVPGVLKYGKLICRDHTGIPGSFGKQLIPLLDIAAHDQSAAVFVQLVETVCHFLPIGLDGK